MKASIDRCGTVTISFESQHEVLLAPEGKKYLPCHRCGKLLTTDMNVVSELCEECFASVRLKGYAEGED